MKFRWKFQHIPKQTTETPYHYLNISRQKFPQGRFIHRVAATNLPIWSHFLDLPTAGKVDISWWEIIKAKLTQKAVGFAHGAYVETQTLWLDRKVPTVKQSPRITIMFEITMHTTCLYSSQSKRQSILCSHSRIAMGASW